MAKVKAQAAVKVKKKNWYPVAAPGLFNRVIAGETYVASVEKTFGKTLLVNLMTLLNDPKKQNIELKFQINDFNDNKFQTELVGYYTLPSSIKRLVRRGKNRIDDSFVCKTSDNKTLKIKPLIITRSDTKRSAISRIRKQARKGIESYLAEKDYETFVRDVVSYNLQKNIRKDLSKIHPVKNFEIRVFELVKLRKPGEDVVDNIAASEQKAEEPLKEEKAKKEVKRESKQEEARKDKPAEKSNGKVKEPKKGVKDGEASD